MSGPAFDGLMKIVDALEPQARELGWDFMLISNAEGETSLLVAPRRVVRKAARTKAIHFEVASVMGYRGNG
ncbi:MAG: hypothetical protein KGL39_06880 [Patescibacteria group bacterium]|nr:hypothetical protein [Patescibacteria group bacterium]